MRILLVTAYYPPLNNIASDRMSSFKKYLEQMGCVVDVITRYYDEADRSGKTMSVSESPILELDKNYMRTGNVIYTNFSSQHFRKKLFNLLPRGIRGLYNYIALDIYMWGWYKYAMQAYVSEFSSNKYDFIIGSYGPTTALQIASRIAKLNNSRFVGDIRDLYIEYNYSFPLILIKKINQYRLLKNASALVFVSFGMQTFFKNHAIGKLKKLRSFIIYNGVEVANDEPDVYDQADINVVNKFQRIKDSFDIVLVHAGTIYKDRNLNFYIDGIESISELKIAIVLIGMPLNNYIQKLSNKCIVLDRVSKRTSYYLIRQADAILQPNNKTLYSGLSGKVFENLFSGKIIITDRICHDDLKAFTKEFPNIVECKTAEEFVNCVSKIHKGLITQKPVINDFRLTREYWGRQLYNELSKIINK